MEEGFKNLCCKGNLHSNKIKMNMEKADEYNGHELFLPDGRAVCLWCEEKISINMSLGKCNKYTWMAGLIISSPFILSVFVFSLWFVLNVWK